MYKREDGERGVHVSCSCSVWERVCACTFTSPSLNEIWAYHMAAITSGAEEGADYFVRVMNARGSPGKNAESCWWSISLHSALVLNSSQHNATYSKPLICSFSFPLSAWNLKLKRFLVCLNCCLAFILSALSDSNRSETSSLIYIM